MIIYKSIKANPGASASLPVDFDSNKTAEINIYIPALHEYPYWRIKDPDKSLVSEDNREYMEGGEKIVLGTRLSKENCFYLVFDESGVTGGVRTRFYCSTENGLCALYNKNIPGGKWYKVFISRYNNGTHKPKLTVYDANGNTVIDMEATDSDIIYDESEIPFSYQADTGFSVEVKGSDVAKIKTIIFYEAKNALYHIYPYKDYVNKKWEIGFTNYAFPLIKVDFDGVLDEKDRI